MSLHSAIMKLEPIVEVYDNDDEEEYEVED